MIWVSKLNFPIRKMMRSIYATNPTGWLNVSNQYAKLRKSSIYQLLILSLLFSWTFSKQVSWRNRALVVTDWTRRFIFGRDSSRIWGRQLTDTRVSNSISQRIICWPSFTFWYLRKILFSNLNWLTWFVE